MKKYKKYTSKITHFINELHKKNPALTNEQQILRAGLWDIDSESQEEQVELKNNNLSSNEYVYFTYNK